MRNYVAVVFDDTGKAYEGLHALWQLDDAAKASPRAAVVHRDAFGNFQVDGGTHPPGDRRRRRCRRLVGLLADRACGG